MKIIKSLKYFLSIGIILASVVFGPPASAMTPHFNGHKFQNGVRNLTAWLNYSSGVGYWEWFITSAVNNWMYTGVGANPIYVTYVSSNNGSNLDFHRKNNSFWGDSTTLAETRFFLRNNQRINPMTSNWFYAEIYINHDTYSNPNFSNDQALGTTIHEIGHALGLDHYNSNPYSIMCQTRYGRVVQRVQRTDNDTVNYLYQ